MHSTTSTIFNAGKANKQGSFFSTMLANAFTAIFPPPVMLDKPKSETAGLTSIAEHEACDDYYCERC